ncbi:MAG TPA: hypothetical protein VK907_08445, partial [Phnomibacter sp.]|nr:hypothetical protein [Phnomibacter sp.]
VHVLFWIMFVGLCIKTGAIAISFFVSLFINPVAAHNLFEGLDLAAVLTFGKVHYIIMGSLLILLTGSQAYIGYHVVSLFLKFDLAKPFNAAVADRFIRISYVALAAGFVAMLGKAYSDRILKNGIEVPIHWAAGEILLFAGVIYLIAQVFQKGIELQTENELTV